MSIVEEVLQTWRDAERVLDVLTPLDPDHEVVSLAVASLRATYRSITDDGAARTSPDVVARSRSTIDDTRVLLDKVRPKVVGA
jgi:hypothetical protein